MKFAAVAHLYKKGTHHTEEPWNWTGWVARWKRRTMWDPKFSEYMNIIILSILQTYASISKHRASPKSNFLDFSCIEQAQTTTDVCALTSEKKSFINT